MTVKLFSGDNGNGNSETNVGYPKRLITEIIFNGLFKVDNKWTVKYWNKAAEKIIGIRAEDIVGKNLWTEFPSAFPLEFYSVYQGRAIGELPAHQEQYLGQMGAWSDVIVYHYDDTVSVSFKSNSHPSNSQNSDHPEQQLKILNELYRFVAEVTNDCLWEWNIRNQEFFWIDGGHKRMFGYQIIEALVPQSFWEALLHPDDKHRVLTKLNEILSVGHNDTWEIEYRFKKADGDYAYVHDRGRILYGEDNKVLRIIGATQDITYRRLADIQLLESERKLSLIARQTVNAIIITDEEERITWVNSAFTRITEYEPGEVIGRRPGSFLQGKDTNPATVEYLRQKIKDKQPFNCEIVNYSKSGRKYWMQIQGQPMLDENGKFNRFFAIETDITEKVILEEVLAKERLEKQREITGAVLMAHENERKEIGKELHDNLNQILGAAKLYIEVAKTDNENRGIYLDKSSEYIVKVIEEIRRVSKTLVTPDKHFLSLVESIRNLVDDTVVSHSIKLSFHQKGIVEKRLDEKLQVDIFRIIQEQLNNILKHSKATSAVIDLDMHGDEIVLLVTDNGVGCDSSTSMGVGLINIKSRAELNQGSVTIVSKPGKGYALKVVLSLSGRK
jgi:PAS domain S-box-containing protein